MRIVTSTMFDRGMNAITRAHEQVLKTEQQLATGRQAPNPSDNPVAAGRALEVLQSVAINDRYAENRVAVRGNLDAVEGTLERTTDVMQNARALVVSAGNAALSETDKKTLATQITGLRDQLLTLANSTDGEGRYLFAGFKENAPPFVKDANGVVQYVGDSGIREVQVDDSRKLSMGAPGSDIFEGSESGESVFKTLGDLVTLLQTPGAATPSTLGPGLGKLDQELDRVLTTRTSMGTRLNELDNLDTAGADKTVRYMQTLSQLQDVDYTTAISDLAQQQTHLEAAQRAFMRVTNLSLFNFF